MKDKSTLSQTFDTGEFIAPDILSAVDANNRAVAADLEVEIPKVERLNAGINKVNIDTYAFNERRMARFHNAAIVIVITVAIVLLLYYLLHSLLHLL